MSQFSWFSTFFPLFPWITEFPFSPHQLSSPLCFPYSLILGWFYFSKLIFSPSVFSPFVANHSSYMLLPANNLEHTSDINSEKCNGMSACKIKSEFLSMLFKADNALTPVSVSKLDFQSSLLCLPAGTTPSTF